MNDARPSGSSATSSARTSAFGVVPKVTTRPADRPANPATTGSSALSTAMPSAPIASTGSAEASTIASHDPKISRCATPTFVTTTMSGRAISHSNVTSPLRRAPISATTTSASAAAPSSVTGRPTSLLNDSGLAWVRNRVAHTAAAMSLVEVLPLAPVMPTTRADIVRRSSAASCRNASPGERTNTAGPVAERPSRSSAPAAPLSNASGTNRPPSVCSPGSATNSAPGPAARESVTTELTSTSAPVCRPSTARATWDMRRGLMRPPGSP